MAVRSGYLALTGMVVVLLVLPAQAQRARTLNSLVSRPTAQGPSSSVGGRYTAGSVRSLAAPRRDVATMGEADLRFHVGSRRISDFAQSLQSVQIGLQAPIGRVAGEPLIMGLAQPATVGYGRLLTPGARVAPAVDAYLYSPRVPTTRVQDLLGLVPTSPRESRVQLAVFDLAAEIEAQTMQRVSLAERAGLALFEEATVEPLQVDPRTGAARYPNCPDCMARLAEASSQLRMAASLQSDAYLPALLLAHAALEQERPMTAVAHLTKAFARNPALIEERTPIDAYFGDAEAGGRSRYLESQMVRFAQIGELNPGSATAQLLSAYCAWRLGDTIRAREAARLARDLAREDPEAHEKIGRLATALLEAR